MKRLRVFLLLLLLLFSSFGFISWSIVTIKLKELKYYISKDQLLNLQLSSEVLRDKFKQLLLYKDDYKKELSVTIQDSTILNSEKDSIDVKLDYKEKIGLVIVNGVRILSFKKALTFLEEKENLIKLQYAYYFERTHKYKKAEQKYKELEQSLDNKNSEEYGFVLLHRGFCLALLGETDSALEQLYETEKVFPGTHFAVSARVLIELLLTGQNKRKEIVEGNLTLQEKIERLYNNGFFKQVLKELDQVDEKDITIPIAYMRARSLEETDAIPIATKEYLRLVVQKENPDVALKANRRLVMISNVYQKNQNLADFSKNKASELGDKEMVKSVEDGTKLILEAKVVQKIEKMASEGEIKKEFAEELKEDKEQQEIIQQEEITQIVEEVKEAKVEEYFVKLKSIKMIILLADERNIEGNNIIYETDTVEVKSGEFSVHIKDYLISEITISKKSNYEPGKETPYMKVTLNDGRLIEAKKIQFLEDSIIILDRDGEKPYPLRSLKKIDSF